MKKLISYTPQRAENMNCNYGWNIMAYSRIGLLLAFLLLALKGQTSPVVDNTTTLGSAVLQPGDIINFVGGPLGTQFVGDAGKYGHSAMYLGRMADTKIPAFFDFQTEGDSKIVTQKTFESRYYERDPKRPIDIFRPKFRLSVEKLQIAAVKLEQNHYTFASVHQSELMVCSQTAFDILRTASTGMEMDTPVGTVAPNSYAHGGEVGDLFEKVNEEPIFIAPSREKTGAILLGNWLHTAKPLAEADAPRIKALEEAEKKKRWDTLVAWAKNACEYMNGGANLEVQQDDLHVLVGRWQRARLYSLVVLSDKEVEQGLADSSGKLDSCQIKLIEVIRSASAPINVDWLVAQINEQRDQIRRDAVSAAQARAEAYNVDGADEFAKKVGRAIKQGAAILVIGITVPFVFIVDSLPDPESGSRSSSEGNPGYSRPAYGPPPSASPHMGSDYGKLIGIAATGQGIH